MDTEEAKRQRKGEQAQPLLHRSDSEIQTFDEIRELPIALGEDARRESCRLLNEILADSQILYALYKKHHWLVRGATFFQLHQLLDKHAGEQLLLIDAVAERVQTLGGVAVGDPRHAADITTIPRAPDGVEEIPGMLARLLEAHEIVIGKIRAALERTEELRDMGTNDLLIGEVLRTHELQVWFVSEHLVDIDTIRI
jgi:starvation-inducible DNA-binding protein